MEVYIDNECDNVIDFDSGHHVFNEYLQGNYDTAAKHYIINEETNDLVGYFSLLASALLYGDPANLNAVPAIELKMFALDKRYQGTNLSSEILDLILTTIHHYSCEYIGAGLIMLQSVPVNRVLGLYKSKGFLELDEDFTAFKDKFTEGCIPMYMYF